MHRLQRLFLYCAEASDEENDTNRGYLGHESVSTPSDREYDQHTDAGMEALEPDASLSESQRYATAASHGEEEILSVEP